MRTDFVPLLFAGDINVYSMARAFHEAYGIRPAARGKFPAGPCWQSGIMDYRADREADREEGFCRIVRDFARENRERKVLLIGCGDRYAQLISRFKDSFEENVIAPYIPEKLMDDLTHKETFYRLCEERGVDYPDTFVHRKETGNDFSLPFDGPFIAKPANGVMYWEHPFPGQKKVYKAGSRQELEQILAQVYASGYADAMIIQNFIPGDDTFMRVLTGYSDRGGKVKLLCLGHVLLEEHTPHGIGNHAVIITEHNETLGIQIKNLLESLGYVGFFNFDIKYDQRDGKYKVFEINTRQGRSNYYVTGAGQNLARIVVEDRIDEKNLPEVTVKEKSLWMVVPKKVAFDYIRPEACRQEMKQLIREGKWVNPLFYPPDKNLRRRLRLVRSMAGHYFKYRKYMGK